MSSPPPIKSFSPLRFFPWDISRLLGMMACGLDRPIGHASRCHIAVISKLGRSSLWLKLRSPDALGKWAWGAWSEEIPLPPTVCTYLWQEATTQAPTLREIRSDDDNRVVVLDLMLEVPAKYVSPLGQESRVLGFDWGVRVRREVA